MGCTKIMYYIIVHDNVALKDLIIRHSGGYNGNSGIIIESEYSFKFLIEQGNNRTEEFEEWLKSAEFR